MYSSEEAAERKRQKARDYVARLRERRSTIPEKMSQHTENVIKVLVEMR